MYTVRVSAVCCSCQGSDFGEETNVLPLIQKTVHLDSGECALAKTEREYFGLVPISAEPGDSVDLEKSCESDFLAIHRSAISMELCKERRLMRVGVGRCGHLKLAFIP